jgi:hypothetical protein
MGPRDSPPKWTAVLRNVFKSRKKKPKDSIPLTPTPEPPAGTGSAPSSKDESQQPDLEHADEPETEDGPKYSEDDSLPSITLL